MKHPYLASSTQELIEEVVTFCIPNGYYFYMRTLCPETGDEEFDREILDKIQASKWRLGRQKGQADVRYLRSGRFCLLMATRGVHPFFDDDASLIRDIRKTPLGVDGYGISCRRLRGRSGYRVAVRMSPDLLNIYKEKLVRTAARWAVEEISAFILQLHFGRYPELLDQMDMLLRAVNRARKEAGLGLVPRSAVGLGEAEVKPLKPATR